MNTNQAGYHRMHADGVPILTRRVHGSGLPGRCRGECLETGQQSRPTPLQRRNAIDGGDVTMPRATKPLEFWFINVGETAVSIWASPMVESSGPADWPARLHLDVIDSLRNDEPFVLEPGQAVTMTGAAGKWSSSS